MVLVNYYDELEISPTINCEEIDQVLKQLRRKWRARMNAAALEDRHKAERLSALIDEAFPILTDPAVRCEYDRALANQSSTRQTANDNVTEPLPFDLVQHLEYLVENQEWEDACRLGQQAINQNKTDDNVLFYYYYSAAFLYEDNPNKSYEYFQKALAIRPDDTETKYWMAIVTYCLEKYDEALKLFGELYREGYDNVDVVSKGLYGCYFEIGYEPMAYEIISEYIRRNPNDAVYRRDAQKAYFDEITKLFGDRDKPENMEQLNLMLDYARKADKILSNGRSREKLEFLEKASRHGINYEEKRKPQRESLLMRILDLFE